jgi:succinate dehydrogenase/fumarate reductase flavoprotein subunit
VGGGGAGLMSAYGAAKNNAKVIVVNKGKVQRTGVTIMAPGAIAAVDHRWKEEGDSKEIHFEDTIKGGCFLNNQEMVKVLVEKSPELVLELERMGALFQRENDGQRYMLRIDGGHSFARCPFLEDRTGKEMMMAMVSALRKLHVEFKENIMITRLIKEEDRVIGAAGIAMETGEPIIFESKAVVLATGGAGTIYENTDNSIDLTGDGYALALETGVPLRDMEFVQFYPLGFLFPPSLKGMLGGLLYYCHLYNVCGERFMEKYDPIRLELSTRDKVSQAIMAEVMEGRGSPRGGVYMDMTYHESGFISKMIPALNRTYQNIGNDPEKDRIEVAPTVHFFMGGLEVNTRWETKIHGLFGAGEICGGMHGGNRLSQNALSEILVSGIISGEEAARYGSKVDKSYISPKEAYIEESTIKLLINSELGTSPDNIKKKIKETMWENVGVYRTDQSLNKALATIRELSSQPISITQKDLYMNNELFSALEVKNMLIVAETVILAALARKESRASHYRSDYPNTDNTNYLNNFYVTKGQTGLEVYDKKVEIKYLHPGVE